MSTNQDQRKNEYKSVNEFGSNKRKERKSKQSAKKKIKKLFQRRNRRNQTKSILNLLRNCICHKLYKKVLHHQVSDEDLISLIIHFIYEFTHFKSASMKQSPTSQKSVKITECPNIFTGCDSQKFIGCNGNSDCGDCKYRIHPVDQKDDQNNPIQNYYFEYGIGSRYPEIESKSFICSFRSNLNQNNNDLYESCLESFEFAKNLTNVDVRYIGDFILDMFEHRMETKLGIDSIIINNKVGINNDHRGSDHLMFDGNSPKLKKNVGLPFTVSKKLENPCLKQFIDSLYLIKSHKFDKWYEMFTDVGVSKSTDDNEKIHFDVYIDFDHGS